MTTIEEGEVALSGAIRGAEMSMNFTIIGVMSMIKPAHQVFKMIKPVTVVYFYCK